MIVTRNVSLEGDWTDPETGEVLFVPSIVVWMAICEEEQVYATCSLAEEDLARFTDDVLEKFLENERLVMEEKLRSFGCNHPVPKLQLR